MEAEITSDEQPVQPPAMQRQLSSDSFNIRQVTILWLYMQPTT
jgi:hypothetical protein